MRRRLARSTEIVLAALLLSTRATAQDASSSPFTQGELDVHADEVGVDARLRELDLKGNVRADAPPFHLSADALHLRRSSLGVVIDGDGRLAFCPCLGTPLTIAFTQATVAPPGDLFLKSARLEIFGLPVFWLPYFWLRAPTRLGLLPPDVQYRGPDGVFLGEGLHLPWKRGGKDNAVDLRGGGYFKGGYALELDARTSTSTTRVRFDRLGSDGLTVDARGALRGPQEQIAWDFDLLRGARGIAATTSLDAASRPYDTFAVEASHLGDVALALGVRGVSARGGPLFAAEAAGPVASASVGGSAGPMTLDAILDGGVLRLPGNTALSFARADGGFEVAGHAGPFGLRDRVRFAGDVGSDGARSGLDGAVASRATVSLPLVRAFEGGIVGDPVRHRIEPELSVAGVASHADGLLGVAAGRGLAVVSGSALVSEAGLKTALGRWGRGDAVELDGAVGTVATHDALRTAARWRLAATSGLVGASAEGAHVLGEGDAFLARVRVGAMDRFGFRAHAAARRALDPTVARALTDAPLAAPLGYLTKEGWSGGVAVSIPWASFLATRGGVDWDFEGPLVTSAWATVELRDKCGCFRVRINGAHRLGREGVDVWLGIDLAPR
jgi:hypothetical protein